MHSEWQAFRTSFERTSKTLQSLRQFQQLKAAEPEFGDFSDPSAAVGFLSARGSDPVQKDRLFAALVRRLQLGESRELVSAMLWLGLWPALDAIFRQYQGNFPDDAGAEVSLIAEIFTDLAARMDLRVVRRVACGLILGTRRNLVRALRRESRTRQRFVATDPSDGAFDLSQEGHRRAGASFRTNGEHEPRGWLRPADDDPEASLAKLRATLAPLIGTDADLLLAVLVLEENQLEAAQRLGLSHAAARKRFQRALALLRKRLL